MATTGLSLISWEEFERLPDSDGFHRELIEGELQVLPPAKSKHSIIASRCYEALLPLSRQGLGQVFLEAGYKLTDNPVTWLEPDASFLRSDRVAETAEDDYFAGGPEIAVEIVSPSESASDLQRKVQLYLGHGTLAVWVIYPKTRSIEVHLQDGTAVTRTMADSLDAPFLSSDWRISVAQLFAD